MSYIFFIATFNALFFAVLIYQKKPRALHDNILVFWLIYLGFYVGVYGLYAEEIFTNYPLLSVSFISLLLLHGPFLYVYITTLVGESAGLKLKYFTHLIPFVLFNLYLLSFTFFTKTNDGISLTHNNNQHEPPLLFQAFLIITALSGPIYFWLSTHLFKKLDINILNNFSTTESINPEWLRKLVYIFGIVWTMLMGIASIHHVFHLFSWIFCTDGIFLSLSIFIILFGYFGLKQREIFHEPDRRLFLLQPAAEKYAGSALKESDAKAYLDKLHGFMASEKPYLNPELNLPKLAKDLSIPSHYLSQVINEHFKMSFFDFINQHRVDEVKSKITDPLYSHYSILGIAFESGFNSKSAFNRVFKKITGLTPSDYKKTFTV
jgi:AraC-like DNA-binding protein